MTLLLYDHLRDIISFSDLTMGVEPMKLQRLSRIRNCKVINLPFTYLGIPKWRKHRKKEFWQKMILKIKKRLSKWKDKYISIVGSVSIIKSVLSNMPLFFFSLYLRCHKL